MALLSCKGLTRRPWFADRDLELASGEVVFLVGPTGSGKSLFMRALADLDPVDAGALALDGVDRDDVEPTVWRRSVLYVHQTTPRLEGSTLDNVEVVLTPATDAGERARAALATFGLAPEGGAHRLSGGEAQLMALARALAVRPRVLLLDESTTAIDPERRRPVEERLAAFTHAGGAILWVSHDGELATRLGARQEAFP